MKRIFFLLAGLVLSLSAFCQKNENLDSTQIQLPRFGVNIDLETLFTMIDREGEDFNIPKRQLGLIYNINSTYRVNLKFGYYLFEEDEDCKTEYQSQLGFYRQFHKPKTTFYYGPEIHYARIKSTNEHWNHSYEFNRNRIGAGLLFGAEYHFTKHFAIGGELNINYSHSPGEDTFYDTKPDMNWFEIGSIVGVHVFL